MIQGWDSRIPVGPWLGFVPPRRHAGHRRTAAASSTGISSSRNGSRDNMPQPKHNKKYNNNKATLKDLPLRSKNNDPIDIERSILQQLQHDRRHQRQADKSNTCSSTSTITRDFVLGTDESGTGCWAGPIFVVSCCCILPFSDDDDAQQPNENTVFVPIPKVADGKTLEISECRAIAQTIFEHQVQEKPESQSPHHPRVHYAVVMRTHAAIDRASLAGENGSTGSSNHAPTNANTLVQQAMAESMSRLARQVQKEQERKVASSDNNDHNNKEHLVHYNFYSIVDGHRAPSPTQCERELAAIGIVNNTTATGSSSSSTIHISCRPWKRADAVVYTVALASCVARTLHDTYMKATAAILYPNYQFHLHGGYATHIHRQALHTYGPSPIHRISCKPVRDRIATPPTCLISKTDTEEEIDTENRSAFGSSSSSLTALPLLSPTCSQTRQKTNVLNLSQLSIKNNFGRRMFGTQLMVACVGLSQSTDSAKAMYYDSKTGTSFPETGELHRLAVPSNWAVDNDVDTNESKPWDAASSSSSSNAFVRLDSGNDALFYRQPRFVEHVDAQAVQLMTAYIQQQIVAQQKGQKQNLALLDLCASWSSHIPANLVVSSGNTSGGRPGEGESPVSLNRIAGLGMNAAELEANPVLTEWAVQDLNLRPNLPYANDSFDIALCQLSIDYLTQPLAVCREIARILKPETGTVHILFSNRLFLSKAVALWTGQDDIDHAYTVASYLHFCQDDDGSPPGTTTTINDKLVDSAARNRLLFANIVAEDLSVRNKQGGVIGDPLYVVRATKSKSTGSLYYRY